MHKARLQHDHGTADGGREDDVQSDGVVANREGLLHAAVGQAEARVVVGVAAATVAESLLLQEEAAEGDETRSALPSKLQALEMPVVALT
ncbi:hypothetical protein HYQ44_019011 [Verticillium longisporum]|nr:hypothetical protein HYQ44_019011 [Verticillium longisporum]